MPGAIRSEPDAAEPTWDIVQLFPAQGDWSEWDYLELTDHRNTLIEFTDGRLEILPVPTSRHQLVALYLYQLLDAFVRGNGLGAALAAPLRLRIRDRKYREPDVLFLVTDRLHLAEDRYWLGADLVIEVVSDDGRHRDFEEKRRDYAEAAIPEYWIVDPRDERILVLALRDGAYVEHGSFGRGDVADSALLPGFRVDVAAAFDRSLT